MGHGERYKRLGIIILLFLIFMFLYGAQAVFTGDTSNYESQNAVNTDSMPEDDPGLLGSFGAVVGFISFLFGGLIFSAPNFSLIFSAVIFPIYFILLVVFWYMIIDWIMDFYETFVPF